MKIFQFTTVTILKSILDMELERIMEQAAQHSPAARDLRRAPEPRKSTGAIVVGVGAFSSSLRGLKRIPAKWRCLVPPTSG